MQEGLSLQRGMNFGCGRGYSVILMSVRPGAPCEDEVREFGRILVYEGHDASRSFSKDPKSIDQPERSPKGTLTQNGRFKRAADEYKQGAREPEAVRVYEKIKDGIWSYNGTFKLLDGWTQGSNGRSVFKFKLELSAELSTNASPSRRLAEATNDRLIPTWVKLEVWKRDHGKFVRCGSGDKLHFDHIIPYSKGGSSTTPDNVQILCERHNLDKRDRIE
jgi:hypothetical protein